MKKYCIILLMVLCVCFNSYADDSNNNADLRIENISYNYQMDYSNPNKIDCIGTLELDVIVPDGVSYVYLERTVPHVTDPSKIRVNIKAWFYPPKEERILHITRQNIRWGTYFRARVTFEDIDKKEILTPFIGINSYIDTEDLDKILKQSSVNDPIIDPVKITAVDGSLVIDSPEEIMLNVSDLNGISIYSGLSYPNMTIPVNSSLVIVRYVINDKSVTKKILIK